MNLYLVVLICTISLISCTKTSKKISEFHVITTNRTDTVYTSDYFTVYDSNHFIKSRVYNNPKTNNDLYSKEFYPSGGLQETYIMDYIPPIDTDRNYKQEYLIHSLDSIVMYREDGTLSYVTVRVLPEGYSKYQASYDSLGNIESSVDYQDYRNLRNRMFYYRDGKIGYIQVDSLLLPYKMMSFDSTGAMVSSQVNKFVLDTVNDYFMFISTEYEYEHGRVVNITHNKSFEESLPCPCGKWVYYNKRGKVIKTIKYPDCNNFNTDYCDSLKNLEKENEE